MWYKLQNILTLTMNTYQEIITILDKLIMSRPPADLESDCFGSFRTLYSEEYSP